jgi:deazaflavin-dependent oxidoreductase (nitroreductase family)
MASSDPNTTTRSVASPLARTAQRLFTGAHAFVYRLTGGALGGSMFNGPVLLLTTTGRKSGKQRTAPLLYIKDGENMVIVASNGGADRPPTWWLNLKGNPEAQVQIGRAVRRVRAEQANPAEKQRLWPILSKMYPAYDEYQKKTTREIPLVLLRPIS